MLPFLQFCLLLTVNLLLFKIFLGISYIDNSIVDPIKKFIVYILENFMDFSAEVIPETKIEKETVQEGFSLKPYLPAIVITCAVLVGLYFCSRNFGGDSGSIIEMLNNQDKFNFENFRDLSKENATNFENITKDMQFYSQNTNTLIKDMFLQITEQLGRLKTRPANTTIQQTYEQLCDYYRDKS